MHRRMWGGLLVTLALLSGCAGTPQARPAAPSTPMTDLRWLQGTKWQGTWISPAGAGTYSLWVLRADATGVTASVSWTDRSGREINRTWEGTLRDGRLVFPFRNDVTELGLAGEELRGFSFVSASREQGEIALKRVPH
jgi:hypothetical protein